MDHVGRLVALGASNLTRGLHVVVASARHVWGPDVEVIGALGHGRSYGAPSQFLARTLPGILESGIWRHLTALPPSPTRALVTDVGNDLLYGFGAGQTLAWVRESVDRLETIGAEVVLTDLPMASIRKLSSPAFLAIRSILVPSCRLTLTEVVDAAERVNEGLVALAGARGLRLTRLDPAWYGFDPIHLRPAVWTEAWQHIVSGDAAASGAPLGAADAWRLYLMRPDRQWLFGREQTTPQTGRSCRGGGRVWLF